MPLPPPRPRRPLTRRQISCEGHHRDDGQLDIDGLLTDISFEVVNSPERGPIEPGRYIHEMHLRLTIDGQGVIQAIDAAMDATPFGYCTGAVPNLQRLVGVRVTGGFRKLVQERVGHTEGCTHLVTLLGVMSTVAIRSLAASRRGEGREAYAQVFATRGQSGNPLLNSCRSYAADSPVVRTVWPELAIDGSPAERKPNGDG